MHHLQARAREIGGEHAAKVATVSGRYYAMDRDNRWDRTAMTYFAMTRGEGIRASSAVEAIQHSYEQGGHGGVIVAARAMGEPPPARGGDAGGGGHLCAWRPGRAHSPAQ